ncbi:hypothetical protein A2W13_03885 [Candidatus Woesebacteria bacterium RBG_16_36_11]|uniref:ABC transmembrane type-1 domain-containing protein n=3 Tax=Candidatus Woeseibacteriota TaxID=1752722 RepID=A0A1F7XAL0_9BACT|nr:MAG: hypothetical protein A2Z67_00805 [Candidatus Woesebacteria bacterium RBG_13_36_22]OGM11819.1 MAG: hypothetical protein A2W13_03885 [Candidatus Woesebacteria bacterium RBG_16_36_11]OGM17576.1 MAG: hypothetical protein A2V55_00800 [Candidatus Woesebacteria bacterium RBG_19FT_COMBO_37_29]
MVANKHNFVHHIVTSLWSLIKGLTVSLIWILISGVGLVILKSGKSPIDLLIGLPLLLIGGGFVINYMWTSVLTIFSPTFNREVCKLCGK